MTTLKACSIHDTKAECWTRPMFFMSVGEALRAFGDACRDENSQFGKHPEDYNLFICRRGDVK